MKNIDLLKVLAADLESFAADNSARLSLTGTYVESLDALAARPQGSLIILEWRGEENPDSDNDHGVMRHEIGIYIAMNTGLKLKQGDSLWASADGKSLLERSQKVRDRVRSILLADDDESERTFYYRGCAQVVTPEGMPLRAYLLTFHITAAITEPEYRNINVIP